MDARDPEAITPQQALDIANAVFGMKAVDPASGSGAFLLGVLQEILALNDALFRAEKTPESLYQQKLDIITKNIHGADKDGLAVSTAMLRPWLSLAVDYEGEGVPDPLPNLDMKLAVGDAIAGPNPQQLDFTLQGIVKSGLGNDIAEYTTAQGTRKGTLKLQIEQRLRDDMGDAAPKGVVEWRIDFADVMLTGGFDVVIANPPYLRHEDIEPKSYKFVLSNQYSGAVTSRSDLYCYFYARGVQLLKNTGVHLFVCSNAWLDSQYGVRLQEYLLNQTHIHSILESAVERQFSTAAINTTIAVLEKDPPRDDQVTRFVSLRNEFDIATADHRFRKEVIVNNNDLIQAPFGEGKWGGRYLRAPDIYHHLMKTIARKSSRLSDYVRGERYLNTGGADGFFVLTDVTPDRPGFMRTTIGSKEGRDHGCPEFLI